MVERLLSQFQQMCKMWTSRKAGSQPTCWLGLKARPVLTTAVNGVSQDSSEDLVASAARVFQLRTASWTLTEEPPIRPGGLAPTKRVDQNYLLYI
jgi:hypothetical protein